LRNCTRALRLMPPIFLFSTHDDAQHDRPRVVCSSLFCEIYGLNCVFFNLQARYSNQPALDFAVMLGWALASRLTTSRISTAGVQLQRVIRCTAGPKFWWEAGGADKILGQTIFVTSRLPALSTNISRPFDTLRARGFVRPLPEYNGPHAELAKNLPNRKNNDSSNRPLMLRLGKGR
jgi:hypothetical protein